MRASSPPHLAEGRPLSVAEWAALPEDEPGELVDGRLVEEEMPDLGHEVVVSWLVRLLGSWLRPRGGIVVGSELKLGLASGRGRKADVAAYLPGHPPLPRHGAVRIPPDLLVEVVSPTSEDRHRDRIDKRADYAAFGVRWYWLVDPEAKNIEVLERAGDAGYTAALTASAGTISHVPGCEGLVLDLDALWAELDELVDDDASVDPAQGESGEEDPES
jgi:Uma2 family endonuclease